jgi:hypothetical protein
MISIKTRLLFWTSLNWICENLKSVFLSVLNGLYSNFCSIVLFLILGRTVAVDWAVAKIKFEKDNRSYKDGSSEEEG